MASGNCRETIRGEYDDYVEPEPPADPYADVYAEEEYGECGCYMPWLQGHEHTCYEVVKWISPPRIGDLDDDPYFADDYDDYWDRLEDSLYMDRRYEEDALDYDWDWEEDYEDLLEYQNRYEDWYDEHWFFYEEDEPWEIPPPVRHKAIVIRPRSWTEPLRKEVRNNRRYERLVMRGKGYRTSWKKNRKHKWRKPSSVVMREYVDMKGVYYRRDSAA